MESEKTFQELSSHVIPSATDYQLIRIDEVSAITTLGKSSINLWVAQGRFPKPIALSSTVKVWLLRDITAWINAQAGVQS
jgi:predicted DNA-binding transcriptional regulator AlpA